MTVEAVRNRQKVVTRRHVDTWKTLKAGDRLTLIEKGMGLPAVTGNIESHFFDIPVIAIECKTYLKVVAD